MSQNNPDFQNINFERDLSEEAVKERHYLWMARTFALILVVSGLTSLMLLTALTSLLPIVRVQPFFLRTLNKDEQVIDIRRPSFANISMPELTEAFVRQYILSYYSIGSNISELEERWGIQGDVNSMSSTTVFSDFTKHANEWIKRAKTEGLTRNVNIRVVGNYAKNEMGDVWRAEVEFEEMTHTASEPTITKWVILVQPQFSTIRKGVDWENRLKNPLGFIVQKLGITRADSK